MIESDHDLRNPTMILLEWAPGRLPHDRRCPGAIHHPSIGHAADHTSIPFQISAQSAGQLQNSAITRPCNDLLKQVGELDKTIGILRNQATLQQQANDGRTNRLRVSPNRLRAQDLRQNRQFR
jgi:RND superfamily putative drug exporter